MAIVKFNPTETSLRKLVGSLDVAYTEINQLQTELIALQLETFSIEAEFHKQLNRYAKAVGAENVPEEFLDYGYLS